MSELVHCGCGRTYTDASFRDLPLCGVMPDEEGRELELRSCSSCGRLVALDVTPDPTEPALPPALRLAPLAKCMPTGAPSAEVGS